MKSQLINLDWQGRPIQIEYDWLGKKDKEAKEAGVASIPLMIFLHEGLGSLAMWKDFPAKLCEALGISGLVYSRPGYGSSSPRLKDEKWPVSYMHQQAFELLPSLLAKMGVTQAPWLFGHSDGGSIALLYASRFKVAGLIVAAPHIMVEDITVSSIQAARQDYLQGDLRQRLHRYHADVDSAFWGWNDIWLNPEFRQWSIKSDIPLITAPILAVQGIDDAYGTMAQIHGIASLLTKTKLLELPQCGHSPHKDQPGALIQACRDFIREIRLN